MPTTKLDIQQALRRALRASPARGHIRRVSLFGSHLHGDAREDSDIDLLLEYIRPFSLLDLVHLESELSEHLGKKVDLHTPKCLSKYIRDGIIGEAQLIYESG